MSQQDSSTTSHDGQVAACARGVDARTPAEKEVASADFTTPGMDARSDVTIIKTALLARQDLAAMAAPKAVACFRWFFPSYAATLARPGTELHIVSVNTLPIAHYGEGSFGFRVVMNVVSGGTTAVTTVDEVGFIKGRFEISAMFTGTGPAFAPAMEGRLMALLASRAAKAPAI